MRHGERRVRLEDAPRLGRWLYGRPLKAQGAKPEQKVPLADLPDTKANVRSALNRATQQRGIEVATSSDADHLYIWKPDVKQKG